MIDDKYIKIGQAFTGSPETTGSIRANMLKIVDIFNDIYSGNECVKLETIAPKDIEKFSQCEIKQFKRLLLIPKGAQYGNE